MKRIITKQAVSIFTLLLFTLQIYAQTSGYEKYQYISPRPGSAFVNPENSIVVRQGNVVDRESVSEEIINVYGSKSGVVSGKVKLSVDERSVIFIPDQPFLYGESVSVEIKDGMKTTDGAELPPVDFSFSVQEYDNTQLLIDYYQSASDEEVFFNGTVEPADKMNVLSGKDNDYPEDFPAPTVTELDNPADGYIFCTLRLAGSPIYNNYITILDQYGVPVYYKKATDVPNDLKVIPDNKLAYCNFNNANVPDNAYYVMDSWFNVIDTLQMGNGYYVDQHDLLMLENGDRYMMAYDPQVVDMSQIVSGGDPNATVIGFIVQRLDSEDNVTFQWRSWDYFEITDATDLNLLSDRIDYVHGNAFDLDDNNTTLLMSCRHMDEITKIDVESGDIIWRLGLHSINNEFTFIDDTVGFCRQHDIRVLPNGNITMYDNGNCHNPSFSQSWEYTLDLDNMTATPAWNYVRDPFVYGAATGSSRRQENGNTFICWGFTEPIGMTEVTPEGETTWELNVVDHGRNYRAVKDTWQTDLFTFNQDSVDFGTYDDYVPWPKIILLTNNSDQDIEITSTHNYLDCYQVTTPLPLTVPAGATVNFGFQLFPTLEQGQLDDVLTLNYDSFVSDTLPQRIARQIHITAFVADEVPPVATINPADGSTNVPLDTQLKINFNESVVRADGSTLKSSEIPEIVELKKEDDNGEAMEFSAYIDAWKRQIVITAGLESKQQYFLKLKAGSVADKLGHVLTTAKTSTFTTADVEAPQVVFFPEDSATDVKRNVVVTLTFDEKIVKAGGDELTDADLPAILVYKENDGSGADVSYTATLNEEKTSISISADDDLGEYQQYYSALLGNTLQDESGNIKEDTVAITFTTGETFGIPDNDWSDRIRVFPNPGNGLVTMEFAGDEAKTVRVHDVKGNLVHEATEVSGNSYQLDISGEADGIYFIQVKNENNQTTEIKFIKN